MISNEMREIKINANFIFTYDNAKFEEIALALCISPEQLECELIHSANAISNMFVSIIEIVKEIRKPLACILTYKMDRDIYKIDFSRPQIKHQVLDRKPKRLIKKIIY